MKNLEITKKLSLVSLICVGIALLFRLVVIFFPEPFLWLFARGVEAELPLSVQLILLGQTACILPFGLVSLFGFLKKNSTNNSAMGLLISAPILYLFSNIGSSVIRTVAMKFMAISDGSNGFILFNVIQIVTSFFSVIYIASLVLICCAGSLELYITKQEKNI